MCISDFSFHVTQQRNYMCVPETLDWKCNFCSDTHNIIFRLVAEQVRPMLTLFLIEIFSFLKHVRSETFGESIRSISTVWSKQLWINVSVHHSYPHILQFILHPGS